MTATGLVLLAVLVADAGRDGLLGELGVWMFAGYVLLGELLSIRVRRGSEQVEVTTSCAFSFALLLTLGPAPAAIAQVAGSLVADVVRRKPLTKAAFNVAQYTLSLAVAGLVLAVTTDLPRAGAGFRLDDLAGVIAAAGTFFLLNFALLAVVIALLHGVTLRETVVRNVGFQARTDAVVLAMSPIVVAVAERNLLLIPLLALPMWAVYRSARVSFENERLVDVLRTKADETEHRALHDALTDLPNRTLFNQRLAAAIDAASSSGTLVAVMLMDLDRFKEINDTLGHKNGDLLLQKVAARLTALFREGDTIARFGGDEFAVLLPSIGSAATATDVARRIETALEAPFPVDDMHLEVGASIGIALFPEHGGDGDTLLQRADVAMYSAKAGHSSHELYSAERDGYSARRLTLVGELRNAIDNRELTVHYQPKASLQTGRIDSVEALVRWQHPTRGMLFPDEFIPIAEHTGLIRGLTLAVMELALRDLRDLAGDGLTPAVAVNLSTHNLLDRHFDEQVTQLLRRWNVDPSRVLLEITEGSIMADPTRAMAILSALTDAGMEISIDDFGTGYSSLAYLSQLPVSEVKIDKSFVMQMADNASDAVIVRSVIDLGHNLGLRVVAEGVEDAASWHQLARLGCNSAQGYLLSRPVSAPALRSLLHELRGGFRPVAPAEASRLRVVGGGTGDVAQ
ncbi:MAG TPA: EAL domain-containing protein [Actinomycetota bacterium]|nr:EAL domain-containing protein [Actinomycetota bacterium]